MVVDDGFVVVVVAVGVGNVVEDGLGGSGGSQLSVRSGGGIVTFVVGIVGGAGGMTYVPSGS